MKSQNALILNHLQKGKKEIWKIIPGFKRYEASSLGRIRSLARNWGKLKLMSMTPHYLHKYLQNRFCDDKGRARTMRIHQLVALAFISNPNNLPHVNHKNGIKTDNRAENLEWITNRENAQHYRESVYRTSGRKLPVGVRETKAGHFSTKINCFGLVLCLGTYKTIQEAQYIYSKAHELLTQN